MNWLGELWESRQQAAREEKPIFIWAMNGHPLGCVRNNGIAGRALVFANPQVVRLLNEKFVPVAVDNTQPYLQPFPVDTNNV